MALRILSILWLLLACGSLSAEETPTRLLLVTHAGGYMHDSIRTAEQVLKQIGPEHGLELTCYRYTADPDVPVTVSRKENGVEVTKEMTALEDYSERYAALMGEPVTHEQCGRVNASTLKNFDVVLFMTSSTWSPVKGSHPLTPDELGDLLAWVRNGGGFAAVHCGSDTLHNSAYGELVGGTFGGHPWVQKIRIHAEDANHPAATGLVEGSEIHDEIYQFGAKAAAPNYVPLRIQPYSRDRLHIILSVDNSSIDVSKGARADHDYPISWCQEYGTGRSFYTSLGHFKSVWNDPRFQEHLLGGVLWAAGRLPGDATPSGRLTPSGQ